MTAVEALVRWKHPKRGLVGPGEFIEVVETIGLIADLGEWVLKSACRQAAKWNATLAQPIRVAVNISSQHFRDGRIVDAVTATLAETGLAPGLLEIEVTESTFQTGSDAIAVVTRLRQLGVQIAIDDFGTGYSCLDSLRKLPVDTLKVDQRFIQDLLDNPENPALVGTIISMARAMGLSVVAEGVETIEQVQFLHALGCRMAQGYYFSKPLPSAEVIEVAARTFLPGHGVGRVAARSVAGA